MSAAVCSAQSLATLEFQSSAVSNALAGADAHDGAFAVENNISAIALSDRTLSAKVTYSSYLPSIAPQPMISAGASYKFGKIGLGIIGKRLNQPEYELINENGVKSQVNGTFKPNEMMFGVGGAYRISESLSAGASFCYVMGAIAPEVNSNSAVFAVSASFSKDALDLGANVGNKGAALTASYGIMESLRAYGYGRLGFGGTGSGASVAAEYTIARIASVRCGYHFGDNKGIPSYLSVGAGAKFAGISLDAAYFLLSDTLGGSLGISLGYEF